MYEMLIKSLELTEFDYIVAFEHTFGGQKAIMHQTKEWLLNKWNFTHIPFSSEREKIKSEISFNDFIIKCIIPLVQDNKVLFLTRGYSECSLATNLDQVLSQLEKRQPKTWQILTAIGENFI